ncbi:MAG: LPS export ABC transporter periplasmic protein LptC [Stagnimonas sp.]|nr:LPS export ABC transporter periplasmic protein LptC [Stagnimonas sp.]
MKSRYWLGIPALILAVWLGLGDFHGDVDPAAEAAAAFAPRYRIETLRLMRTDAEGVPALELRAASADYYDDGSAQLKMVAARGLSGSAAPWQLTAPQGLVPVGQRRLKLLSPVAGTGQWPDGERFQVEAQDVWVDDAAKQFESALPIRISSETRSANARGFKAPFDGHTLQLNSVEMRYALRD